MYLPCTGKLNIFMSQFRDEWKFNPTDFSISFEAKLKFFCTILNQHSMVCSTSATNMRREIVIAISHATTSIKRKLNVHAHAHAYIHRYITCTHENTANNVIYNKTNNIKLCCLITYINKIPSVIIIIIIIL